MANDKDKHSFCHGFGPFEKKKQIKNGTINYTNENNLYKKLCKTHIAVLWNGFMSVKLDQISEGFLLQKAAFSLNKIIYLLQEKFAQLFGLKL